MSKNKITISTSSGETYTLEYDTKSARQVGRDIEAASGDQLAYIDALVHNAFVKNHNNVSKKVRDEVYADLPEKEEFLALLGHFYQAVLAEKLEDKDAKSSWEVSE